MLGMCPFYTNVIYLNTPHLGFISSNLSPMSLGKVGIISESFCLNWHPFHRIKRWGGVTGNSVFSYIGILYNVLKGGSEWRGIWYLPTV